MIPDAIVAPGIDKSATTPTAHVHRPIFSAGR